MNGWPGILALAGLAACAPQPRDAAWFAKHPSDAKHVLASCEAGYRNAECENARAGLRRAEATVRRERYREGFE